MCDDVEKAQEVWNYLNDGPMVKAREELKQKEEADNECEEEA